MNTWEEKRVLVTGGAGFIGSRLVEMLVERGARVRVADNLERGSIENMQNVRNEVEFCKTDLMVEANLSELVKDQDVVMNLAAKVGGVLYNSMHHGTMFRRNVILSLNVLEAARKADVERFLCVSSACVYPRDAPIPTPESAGFVDDPEPTNLGYGWAKRMAEVHAWMYSQEYGLDVSVVRPYNAYGPRDDFHAENAHVIASLIRKISEGQDPLIVWGDGTQTRSFVFVDDVARGMLHFTEHSTGCQPVNIGSDEEISMGDLARKILRIAGRNPRIEFDISKPSGQPRRNADIVKAKSLGFEARVPLDEGLKTTFQWYASRSLRADQESDVSSR
jgi:GDP-L-fucose synthase